MTEAEAFGRIMTAVLNDRDRSLESAITRGIQAGAALERERIRALISLPAAKGLECAAIALALSGACSIEAAAELLEAYAVAPTPATNAEVRARRAAFKIINNSTGKDLCDAKLDR